MATIGRILAAALMGGFFMLVFRGVALPKNENGKWDNIDPQTREWFKSLRDKNGVSCCDTSDAKQLGDDDWKVDDFGKFLVRFEGKWFEVPRDRVLNVPNAIGAPLLFISPFGHVYCFIPTSLS